MASEYGLGPSPSPSRRQSEGRLTASSSMNSLRASSPEKKGAPGTWKKFMSGAKRFVDALADIVDLEENESITHSRSHSRNLSSLSGVSALDLEDDKIGIPGHSVESEPVPTGNRAEPLPLLSPSVEIEDIPLPSVSEESNLVSLDDMRLIASHMPLRHRTKKWTLLYSTLRDGISMQTLLRKSKGKHPTVLIVRDMSKNVFGAFCSESWRISSRYYGTGETFVFRVDPEPAVWHWWWKKSSEIQNDFFMWGSHDAIAVGGAGGYAMWLDRELSRGVSRCSTTFGNDSLSSSEEFRIGAVELWHLD